ncbi:hypothetical protein ACTNEF_01460 [Bariatricus sp. HCP28S3_E4]|uniref:hypothetical protein n=1 Tax=unclassified Bariatricus TaxID=2677046 RepID=UPI003F899D17
MTRDQVKQAVVDYVRENEGTSYAELERLFERIGFDYKGDFDICVKEFPNVVIWFGWNMNAVNIISELESEKLIFRDAVPSWVYLADGRLIDLPVVDDSPSYKHKKCWLPVGFFSELKD